MGNTRVKQKIKEGIIERNIQDIYKEGWKVDKAKIKYLADNLEEIQKLINVLAEDSRVIKTYQSNDFKKCNKNFIVELKGGVLYIGIGSNAPKGIFNVLQRTIVIEYNPQKIDVYKEVKALKFLKGLPSHRRKVMYIDMAYDMYINIEDITYRKRQDREYECIISHLKKETIYLREFGENGSTRIYNKTKEKNKGNRKEDNKETKEKYIGDCTRYEIRVKPGTMEELEPFSVDKLIDLHDLNIKGNDELITREMEKESPTVFRNLYMVHIGKLNMTDKNKKKEYLNKYDEIKKRTLLEERKDIFKNFNVKELSKILKTYLDYTIIEKESKLSFINMEDEETETEDKNEEKLREYYNAKEGIFLYCNLNESGQSKDKEQKLISNQKKDNSNNIAKIMSFFESES